MAREIHKKTRKIRRKRNKKSAEGEGNDKGVKWLHAGVLRNIDGEPKDAWYSFRYCKAKDHICDGFHIQWARTSRGKQFGNRGVGQIYRNLISFNDEHQRKYFQFLSPKGTWIIGMAKKGRKHQRQTLLDHWLDPRSKDRFPQGRAQYGFLGPPLNVVHSVNDLSGGVDDYNEYLESVRDPSGPCYPGTNIPLSFENIKPTLWKQDGRSSLSIAASFLSGEIATHQDFTRLREWYEQLIESAFYAEGYRIDRYAMAKANEELCSGAVDNAFRSTNWKNNLPLRVDRFKGDQLSTLMRNMRRAAAKSERDSDESSDSDDQGGDGGGDGGGGDGPSRRRGRPSDSGSKRRIQHDRNRRNRNDDDNDDNKDGGGRRKGHGKKKKHHRSSRHKSSKRSNRSSNRKSQVSLDHDEANHSLLEREASWASPGMQPRSTLEPGLKVTHENNILNCSLFTRLAAEEGARKERGMVNNSRNGSYLEGKYNNFPRLESKEGEKRSLPFESEDEIKQEDDDDVQIDEERTAAARAAKRIKYRVEKVYGTENEIIYFLDSDEEADDKYSMPIARMRTKTSSPSPVSSPTPHASPRSRDSELFTPEPNSAETQIKQAVHSPNGSRANVPESCEVFQEVSQEASEEADHDPTLGNSLEVPRDSALVPSQDVIHESFQEMSHDISKNTPQLLTQKAASQEGPLEDSQSTQEVPQDSTQASSKDSFYVAAQKISQSHLEQSSNVPLNFLQYAALEASQETSPDDLGFAIDEEEYDDDIADDSEDKKEDTSEDAYSIEIPASDEDSDPGEEEEDEEDENEEDESAADEKEVKLTNETKSVLKPSPDPNNKLESKE